MNDGGETIVDLLHQKAGWQPDRTVYSFLGEGNQVLTQLDYGTLNNRARGIAAMLQDAGASGGQAVLLYPPGLEFIQAFFGCLYAGVVAIPAYPPDPVHFEQTLPRLMAVMIDSQAKVILTTTAVLRFLKGQPITIPLPDTLRWLATDILPADAESAYRESHPRPNDLAYLQYTSGSTRTPRGVRLTHTSLLENTSKINEKFGLTNQDTAIIWLPIQHNMGLIGGVLQPFFSDVHCVMMSPQAFLQQPLLWLDAISRHKGTVSGGPNFAFDLCLQRIRPEQCVGLDLSTWRLAFNGAEPVRPDTLDRFTATFQPYGFKRESFYPCYGLAEATLLVTAGQCNAGPVTAILDKKALEQNQAIELTAHNSNSTVFVGCGTGISGHKLLVVNPATMIACEPGEIGELWIAGPCVADGYWNHPEETAETFQGYLADSGEGPFLRTGDLGFLRNGECFITGRIKDLIIIRGRNHYPQDIEKTVEQCHPALIPNGGAAVSVEDDNEEKLVIVQEAIAEKAGDLDLLAGQIRQRVSEIHELSTLAIVFVSPGTILRTVSGKIQRQATRKQYLEGSLQIIHVNKITRPVVPSSTPQAVVNQPDNLLHAALVALGPEKGKALLESHLLGKVAELLKISPSSLDASTPLTSMGLDSVTSVELASEVDNALGVSISLEKVLQGETIAGIAADVMDQLGGVPGLKTNMTMLATNQQLEFEDYPLSYGQRALWFVQRMDPQIVAHNIVYAGTFLNALDLNAMRKVFVHIIDRYAILRTTFVEVNGLPRMHVHPEANLDYQTIDATGWSQDQIDRRIAEEVYRPFDLTKGSLLRVIILKQAPEKFIMLLALHHIVTDLWSMAILLHELGQFYAAETKGQLPEVKPVTMQYSDHVEWEEEMLSGPDGEAHWQYWKNRLNGDLAVVNLPTDRPRPPMPTAHGAAITLRLGTSTTKALRELSRACNVNLFSTLLAAFYTLLYRYTGQTDILIGTPKANRNRQTAAMMGYFINPVVLRANLEGNPSFRTLLGQVYQNVQSDFQHDAFPFPLLVEKLQPGRDLSASPLFQIFYSWQKTTRLMEGRAMTGFALGEEKVRFDLNGLTVEVYPLKERVTPTDLALLVAEADEDIGITMEYATDLFEQATIDALLQHFLMVIQSILANPDCKVASLSILTKREQEQLLIGWKEDVSSQSDIPVRFLHEWVEITAEKCPDQLAVTGNGKSVSYIDLVQRSRTLAGYLRQAGVGPETVIAVSLDRSPDVIMSLLGIWMAGAAFLPLDPDFPASRREFMVKDSNANLILTHAKLAGDLQKHTARILCLDIDWNEIEQGAALFFESKRPLCEAHLENLSYVMYTSGSTGNPKAVMISHQAIAYHCCHIREFYALGPQDRVLQFANLNFDAALEQMFTALISGSHLFLRDQELWDPSQFSQKINELGLTVINVPPAYWQQWLQADEKQSNPISNPQLRLVIIGGDVMQPEMLDLWERIGPKSARLINAYGPTETTITATAYEVMPGVSRKLWHVPIGKPLCNRKALILDSYLQPVPIGVPGELYIGGPCLARGYLNQPDLTRDKFIPDPFSSEANRCLYKTGDLARFLSDGNIEFLGRVDRQLKIRGIRIEPGEIESVLRKYPLVREAAVFMHDSGDGLELAAGLAVEPDHEVDLLNLRDFLSQYLPLYMIPANYFVCNVLPLTAGGKIDRQELVRAARLKITGREYIPPRNPLEEDLVSLWKTVLHRDQIGVCDDFFSLGGHSLLATQLISRVQDKYHVELPLRRLFETPTVAGLASAITQELVKVGDEEDLDKILGEIEKM